MVLGMPGVFSNRKEASSVGADGATGEKERNQDHDLGFYTKWNQRVTEGSQQTADKSWRMSFKRILYHLISP